MLETDRHTQYTNRSDFYYQYFMHLFFFINHHHEQSTKNAQAPFNRLIPPIVHMKNMRWVCYISCSEVRFFHFVQRSESFEEKCQKSFLVKITYSLSYFIFIKKPCCCFIELLKYIVIYSRNLKNPSIRDYITN